MWPGCCRCMSSCWPSSSCWAGSTGGGRTMTGRCWQPAARWPWRTAGAASGGPAASGPGSWRCSRKAAARRRGAPAAVIAPGPRELAVLQEVCGWRERVARGSDRPRGHVLPDALCLELARQLPTSLAELQAHRELPRRLVKPHGADVLAAIEAGRARPAASWPQLPRPLTSAENRHLKQLRSVVGERAGGLELAPELLARRRDLESLLRRRQLPSLLQGWRQPVVGEPLLDALGGLLEN